MGGALAWSSGRVPQRGVSEAIGAFSGPRMSRGGTEGAAISARQTRARWRRAHVGAVTCVVLYEPVVAIGKTANVGGILGDSFPNLGVDQSNGGDSPAFELDRSVGAGHHLERRPPDDRPAPVRKLDRDNPGHADQAAAIRMRRSEPCRSTE